MELLIILLIIVLLIALNVAAMRWGHNSRHTHINENFALESRSDW